MPIIGIVSSSGGTPGAPTSVSASAGNAQATVSFTAPTYTGKGGAVTYTATSSPGNFTATGSSSPLTVTGLTNGTSYTFTVKTNTSYGKSSLASSASNSITPVAPTSPPTIELFVVAGGGGAANAGAGAGGLCYQAARSVTAGTSYTVTIGAGGAGAPGVNDPGATNGGNSVFDTIISVGGGASKTGSIPGNAGGSGAGEYMV